MGADETFPQRVEGTRADVPVNDPEASQAQNREAQSPGLILSLLGVQPVLPTEKAPARAPT